MFATIIHPTDLSSHSVPALKRAQELAKNLRSKLVVCYITNPPMVASDTVLTNPDTGEKKDIRAEIQALQPEEPGVDRQIRIVTVEDSSDIGPLMHALESLNGELLVLGRHPRKGIIGWFGKSITEEMVSRATCDVLVVQDQPESNESGEE